MLVDADFSAIEWRVCAALTQDSVMCYDILNKVDPHMATATGLMELPATKENRQDAKIFNFRAIYADEHIAAYAFYKDQRMPNFSQKKWEKIMESFYIKYKDMSDVHQQWYREVLRTGELIGPTGRRWSFKKQQKRGGYSDYNRAQIYNYPVQGSSGDIIKTALIYIEKRIRHLPALIINTVHDSIIFDVDGERNAVEVGRIAKETYDEIPDLMYKHFGWRICVPITGEVKIGNNWCDMKEVVDFSL